MRVLLLSGGGMKGAVQLPIIEHLMSTERFDLILGVSVGAINGVLAAQGDIETLKKIWADIDDHNSLFGVKGFLNFAAHRNKGLYSLSPVEKKLQEHVRLDKMITPFGVGVTVRATREYKTLLAKYDLTNNKELHAGILASSAISGFMEGYEIDIGGKDRLCFDGGHRHVLPLPPAGATDITAVFCDKITQDHVGEKKIENKLLQNVEFTLDALEDRNRIEDFNLLKTLTGVKVRVFAPAKSTGGTFDAKQETILTRIEQGKEALKNPIVWETAPPCP